MSTPIGIPNFGNTCWLNSLIQGLLSSQQFIKCCNQLMEYKTPFVTKLLNLCYSCLNKSQANTRMDMIQLLQSAGWHRGMPEDSSEALLWLIEQLHKECKVPMVLENETENGIYTSIFKHNQGETSFIYSYFQGCYGWKTSDNEQRYEPFITFYLDWAQIENQTQNISQCLETTFKNKQIVMMPPLLAICFDRTSEHIKFKCTSEFMLCTPEGKNVVYKLKAIILHIGSLAGGHYVCLGLRDNQWWIFDDDRVSQVEMTGLLNDVPRLCLYDMIVSN